MGLKTAQEAMSVAELAYKTAQDGLERILKLENAVRNLQGPLVPGFTLTDRVSKLETQLRSLEGLHEGCNGGHREQPMTAEECVAEIKRKYPLGCAVECSDVNSPTFTDLATVLDLVRRVPE